MSPHQLPHLHAEDLGVVLPDGRRLFDGLTLSFANERTGLVGPNGVGKTILLDVLAGVRPPSSGSLVRRGRVTYVRQGGGRGLAAPDETVAHRLGLRAALDALERVLAGGTDPADYERIGPDGWDLPERVDAHLARLDLGHLPLGRPMTDVSGGEATRVALAGAFLQEPDLLILDEPTNDLDESARQALLAALEPWSRGLLVVSHDRALLRRMDRIVELTPGGLRHYGGGYDLYRAVRDEEAHAAEAALTSAEAVRRKTRDEARRVRERQARRAARGRRSRSEGGIPKVILNSRRSRSQVTTGRIGSAMDGVEDAAAARVAAASDRLNEVAVPRMDVAPSELPAGKDVVVMEGVDYTPPGSGEPLLVGVELVVRGPDRVAVAGPNGSGKSTLLRLVLGELAPDAGTVRLGVSRRSVAYLDQAAGVVRPGTTVLSCFREAHPGMAEGAARHVLARYLFEGREALAAVDRLSGGERVRAGLACVLGGPSSPDLLVLDEPTNHLDFASLDVVEGAVAAFGGALLVVSHDHDFLAAVGVERTVRLG